jgi:hypothetical protein
MDWQGSALSHRCSALAAFFAGVVFGTTSRCVALDPVSQSFKKIHDRVKSCLSLAGIERIAAWQAF